MTKGSKFLIKKDRIMKTYYDKDTNAELIKNKKKLFLVTVAKVMLML